MEIDNAIGVINDIIDGLNPTTGESLSDSELYTDDKVLETFALCIKGLEFLKSGRNPNLPDKAGRPWSREEDEQLIQEYYDGIKIATLAEIHERTKGAIRSRLRKNGIDI